MADDYALYYVHGTWGRLRLPFQARKPFWFESKSAFRHELEQRLSEAGLQYNSWAFRWSGANSLAHREYAAQSLARKIRQNNIKHPGRCHVIIAHSHGGNVALRAAKILETVDSDRENFSDVKLKIVTLATPFIQLSKKSDSLIWVITLLSAFIFVFFCLILLANIFFEYAASTDAPKSLLRWIVTGAMFIFLSFFLGQDADLRKPAEERKSSRSKWLIGLAEFEPVSKNLSVLVMHSKNDEADIALRFGRAGDNIWMFISAILATFILPMSCTYVSDTGRIGNFYSTEIVLYISALILFSIILTGLFKSTHGRELIFGSILIDISVEVEPRFGKIFRNTRMNYRNKNGLVHSIYTHPRAALVISTWLKAHL